MIRPGLGSARVQGALEPVGDSPIVALSSVCVSLDDAPIRAEQGPTPLAPATARSPREDAPIDAEQGTPIDAEQGTPIDAEQGTPIDAERGAPTVWTATGLERQVFLDHTGRRGRRMRLAGGGMALLSAGWLAALVTGSIGFSTLPSLPAPATVLAAKPAAPLVRVATTRRRRASETPRRVPETSRRVIQTAAVNRADAAAAHALALREISTASGTIR